MAGQNERPDDGHGIEGIWRVVHLHGPEMVSGGLLEFGSGRFRGSIGGDGDWQGSYRLDTAKSPKWIDLLGDGDIAQGIYDLDGDSLRLCLAPAGQRPEAFPAVADMPKEAQFLLLHLQREGPTSSDAEGEMLRWEYGQGTGLLTGGRGPTGATRPISASGPTTSFSVLNVPVARTPLREIPYGHAVAGLLAAESPFGELDHLDGELDRVNWEIRKTYLRMREGAEIKERHAPMNSCYCGGSGECYCKRKGLSPSECQRCYGTGKCHLCQDLPQQREAERKRQLADCERRLAELKQKQAELQQRRPQLVAALDTRFHTAAPGIEACSRYHGRLVGGVNLHPLIHALHLAFCDHRPVCLSPDMIWLLIAQGTANHINANAEVLRPLFVKHQGKVEIIVERNDFLKGSPENPWAEVFPAFTKQIRNHVGNPTHDFFVTNFSTTGAVERAAFEVTLMDAMQSYFDYTFVTICGIPAISLEGTVDDWRAVLERAQMLPRFDLGWWLPVLEPILRQFIEAAEGKPDSKFWQSIYKWQSGSGGPYTSGWIIAFFPYLKYPETGQANIRNEWLTSGGDELKSLLYPNAHGDSRHFPHGLTTNMFPSGLAKAPFTWEYLFQPFAMEFLAGFVGVSQDTETLQLRPEIGWVVRDLELLRTHRLKRDEARAAANLEEAERRSKNEAKKPCPHCGKPLRSIQAKQCFECGADWH